MSNWPIGVFTSLDAGLGVRFDVARELGVPTLHLHAPHQGNRTEQSARDFRKQCDEAGVTVTAVWGGFEGESYADPATSARTVGLVPEETRAERLREMKEISDWSKHLGCPVIAQHIGFIPEDRDGASYKGLLDTTRDLLDHAKHHGQALHLETGQETADHLLDFIRDVQRDNLFVNFDPANMILYGTGEPIPALKKVGRYVRSVHVKDGTWAAPEERGKSWGEETPLGKGDVGIETYLRTLKEIGYEGPLTIEREIAHDPVRQKADIGEAVRLLERLRAEIG
ncbi:MAG: sugar phosphate isomerase/epimerase family protein [Planctomycetaceae bacterium]